jgi:hypothetical protein
MAANPPGAHQVDHYSVDRMAHCAQSANGLGDVSIVGTLSRDGDASPWLLVLPKPQCIWQPDGDVLAVRSDLDRGHPDRRRARPKKFSFLTSVEDHTVATFELRAASR